MIRTVFIVHDDLPGAQSRRVLDWCLARGADAFTISVIGTPGEMEEFGEALDARLAPFCIPTETVRAIPESQAGSQWTHPHQLWRLTAASAEILWDAVAEDLLNCYTTGSAWCEDPMIYRAGELLLGVISHEQEGVMRVSAADELALREAGLPYRERTRWIGC